MSTLTIQIPDSVKQRLEAVARMHGHSLEAEASATLERALSDEEVSEFLHHNPDELLRRVDALHAEQRRKGQAPLTDEMIQTYKNEDRA
jgi:plasmid stability protein